MTPRKYTVSAAVVAHLKAAAKLPRGGARVWTNVRVSSGVIDAIDARRAEGESRNDYLARLLRCKDQRS